MRSGSIDQQAKQSPHLGSITEPLDIRRWALLPDRFHPGGRRQVVVRERAALPREKSIADVV
jgi:hypothetical protein